MEKYYTAEEVAEVLKVSSRTVLRYIEIGELKAVKLNRITRISEKDLKDFLEQKKTT